MRANQLKTAFVSVGVACLMLGGIGAHAQITETHMFSGINAALPDDDPAGIFDAQTVTSAITNLTKVRVFLTIVGTWNGDIYAKLEHASGYSILLNRVGNVGAGSVGYSDDGMDITLEDGATDGDVHKYRDIIGVPPPGAAYLTGEWAPDGRASDPTTAVEADARTALLAGFNGMDANGTWEIHVADAAGGDTHTLNHWSLAITHADSSTTTISSAELGIAVPDNDLTGVTDTLAVSTTASLITDVDVALDLTGTYAGDLYVYLTFNSATAVLANRVGRITDGFGYSDDGFDDVRFNDDATNGDVHVYRRVVTGSDFTPLPSAPAVTGVWEPDARDSDPALVTDADPRTAFLSAFNGSAGSGEWKLTVSDNAGGDLHTLRSWGLELTGTAGIMGDVDGNGCVDDADLTAVILDYGAPESGNNGNTDVDNSGGDVDDADITIVILNFGNGC